MSQLQRPPGLNLFREVFSLYCENHTERVNTVWQTAEVRNILAGNAYSYCFLQN